MRITKWIALAVLALIVIVCAVGAATQAEAVNTIDTDHWQGNPLPPCFLNAHDCGGHTLGTDENGRDIVVRLFAGTQFAMELAAANVLTALAIGALVALAASRRLRSWTAPLTNAFTAFPLWIVAVMFCAVTQPHDPIATPWLTMAIVYGCFLWPLVTRSILQKRSLLEAVFQVAVSVLLADAVVNFLGFGIQPPHPSLGNMLVNGESNMETAPWAIIAPTSMLTLIMFLCRLISTPSSDETITLRTEHPSPARGC